MITILRPWGEDRSVIHLSSLDEAFVTVVALASYGTVWHLVERGDRRRVFTYRQINGREPMSESTGHQLIQLYDALTGSSMYGFTVRSIALGKVHEAIDEIYPISDCVKAHFPLLSCDQ